MTLVEMVIAVTVVGIGLFLLVGSARLIREDARNQLARQLLSILDRALMAYQVAEHSFPPASDGDADAAVDALVRCPSTRGLLRDIPETLWTSGSPRTLVDPWGHPLRYLADPHRHPAVETNQERPIFVSAGRDGDFAEASEGDNLRSDDPGESGFRRSPNN